MTGSPAARTAPARNATLWIAVGSALNGFAAFLFQIVGTRALGPVDYAPISVLWTLQYLWIAVAVTAVEAYVTRLVTIGGPADVTLARFLRLLWRWLAAAAVATSAIGIALRGQLFGGLAELGGVLGLLVIAYCWYGVVRGRAAGVGRFRAYGLATAGESIVRLVLAVAVLAVAASTRSLAWVFPLGPFAVAVWAWGRRHPVARAARPVTAQEAVPVPPDAPRWQARRFLVATSTANASVQFLLAGGPIVLVPLGADAATISVFFTTITAARVPMTFALNGGLSRLLPPLTRMALADDTAGLRRAAVRMLGAILGGGVLAGGGSALLGPEVIALLFGDGFRPDRAFVAIVAVATVLAVGGLLLDQLYIATGREGRLPVVWLSALGSAALLVAVLPGSPTMRVAGGFALALGAAVTALSVPLLRTRR